ncbi:uncharacterized protein LOC133825054 [Humulus lupulus]|uniref:uncharacterized protein LOC133825054 n=1 Tax=Humulus lupulus TaxID=3486 RepID=UPI002B40CBE6|nr:uncharacterized protein LOC133825054 [Humulus lupulus]
MTASWRRLGGLTAQYEKKLDEQLKVSEEIHAEEIRATKEKYNEQLEASKVKYSEQLEAAKKKNDVLLEEKTTLAEELKQHQATLAKVIETKEKYKESSKLNYQEASKLQDDLVISRKETEGLEECVKELEETNASNLERLQLSLIRLEEEERAKIPASLEISLAMGIDGIEEEVKASVN